MRGGPRASLPGNPRVRLLQSESGPRRRIVRTRRNRPEIFSGYDEISLPTQLGMIGIAPVCYLIGARVRLGMSTSSAS